MISTNVFVSGSYLYGRPFGAKYGDGVVEARPYPIDPFQKYTIFVVLS